MGGNVYSSSWLGIYLPASMLVLRTWSFMVNYHLLIISIRDPTWDLSDLPFCLLLWLWRLYSWTLYLLPPAFKRFLLPNINGKFSYANLFFDTGSLCVFFKRLAPNSWFSCLSLWMTSVSPHPATCVLNTCIPCVRKVEPTSYLIYFKKSTDNLMYTYTGSWHLWSSLLSLSLPQKPFIWPTLLFLPWCPFWFLPTEFS